MNGNRATRLLAQSLAELEASRRHLDFSYHRTVTLAPDLSDAGPEQLESAEAFTGRFARVVDLLVNKVLRGVDEIELNHAGTLLDVVNRAEKRGLVGEAVELRELKAVRNAIAHDYAGTRLADIFAFCRERKPGLDAICERTIAYVRQLRA